MNAAQKKIIWVALAHLGLTILVVIFSCITPFVWDMPFRILQPHFMILEVLKTNPSSGFFGELELWVCILAIPVWSFCFGWLCIKVAGWLNRFLSPGKRVL